MLLIDSGKSLEITSEIRVASVQMEKHAARLTTVNTYRVGKFDTYDLDNIEQSLRDTLVLLKSANLLNSIPVIDIHLVIRRYFVAHSNSGAAVLICVAWAATDFKGKMIYHEQFYASKGVYLLGTIGLLKDSVHKAVVRRIAESSLYLASGMRGILDRDITFEDTYTSFQEAVSRLPDVMVSILKNRTIESEIFWGEAEPADKFDWNTYLREFYKNK